VANPLLDPPPEYRGRKTVGSGIRSPPPSDAMMATLVGICSTA
jgi:hypothetical protein